ncbi:hypothetical protein [Mycobacterium sp.]|uniref:hypothetical protein n=1 Tax=Mycobacterium sp. TaxID=1785 RepID=UPI003BA8EE48
MKVVFLGHDWQPFAFVIDAESDFCSVDRNRESVLDICGAEKLRRAGASGLGFAESTLVDPFGAVRGLKI